MLRYRVYDRNVSKEQTETNKPKREIAGDEVALFLLLSFLFFFFQLACCFVILERVWFSGLVHVLFRWVSSYADCDSGTALTVTDAVPSDLADATEDTPPSKREGGALHF